MYKDDPQHDKTTHAQTYNNDKKVENEEVQSSSDDTIDFGEDTIINLDFSHWQDDFGSLN